MANDVIAIKRRARTAEEIRSVLERRNLSVPQRLAIQALLSTTTRTEALKLLEDHGISVDKSTLSRWFKSREFRGALEHAEGLIVKLITKNNVLRKTETLLDTALEGTPILGYVEKDRQEIVGRKPDLPTAARILELQGRAVGLFQDDSAAKIAVMIDIDFSGRKDPAPAQPVVDAEIVPVEESPEPEPFSAVKPEADWLE